MEKTQEQKNVVLDKDGMPKVMSTKEYLGDACGMAGINCLSQVQGQLTYFYTNKVGMNPVLASNAQMVGIIADGFSDLIMGRLVDKVRTKEGKCRPWLKWMIIPLFLAIVLFTTVPKASPTIQGIYAALSIVFGRAVVYTALMIPYYSMINFMTRSLEERGKIGNYRGVFNNGIGALFGMLVFPITNALGGTQKSWIIFAIGTGILASLLVTICYRSTKERYLDEPAKTNSNRDREAEVSTLQSLNILIHNKYWVCMLIAQFALFVVYILQGASLPFYCKYILNSDNFASLINTISLVAIIGTFLIIPPLIRKVGLKYTGVIGIALGLIGTVIRIICPRNIVVFTIGFCLVKAATGTVAAVHPSMLINTCEWNDYHYGYKLAGMTNSASSFGGKMGAAIGQYMVGIILAAGGYNQLVATQSESALNAICNLAIGYSGIFLVVILICFMLYNFDKQYAEMSKLNQARREKEAAKN